MESAELEREVLEMGEILEKVFPAKHWILGGDSGIMKPTIKMLRRCVNTPERGQRR